MSWKSDSIIKYGKTCKGMRFTKKEIVDLLGHTYHCNGAFHIGNILSRLVGSGKLDRVKRGVYEIASPKSNPNHPTLF
jgi:predicted transcriptional regulator of viral defense system